MNIRIPIEKENQGKVAIAIGIFFLLGALYLFIEPHVFQHGAIATYARIIRLIPRTSSKGAVTFAPVFTFTDQAGTQHEITSDSSSSPPIGNVGALIRIAYHESSPNDARIKDDFMDNMLPIFISVVAIICIGIGIWFTRLYPSGKPKTLNSSK